MKHLTKYFILLFFSSSVVSAEETLSSVCDSAYSKNQNPSFCELPKEEPNPACAMVICLSTPTLNNSQGCAMAQKEFFKIKVKKLGIVSLSKTIKKRTEMLESCDGSQKKDTAAIIANYGAIIY